MAKYRIALIRGDGIGPEIVEATIEVLNSLGLDLEFIEVEAGYELWKRIGEQITAEAIETIKKCDCCLKGPTMTPLGPETFRSVAVTLRQALDLYANVRPFESFKGVPVIHENVDFAIIRENTEDLYKGLEYRVSDSAIGVRVITKRGCERIARFAFEFAKKENKKKVTAVHKANVLKETCGLFREVCEEVAKSYPSIEFEEMLVDAAAMRIARNPQHFDVIVTTNVFGDILSDEAAGIVGGLGLAPSANIGDKYAIFEPVHGTAPDIAGKGIANPCALLLSSVMMLKYLGEESAALRLERAIKKTLEEGKEVTPDLGGKASTRQMSSAIMRHL